MTLRPTSDSSWTYFLSKRICWMNLHPVLDEVHGLHNHRSSAARQSSKGEFESHRYLHVRHDGNLHKNAARNTSGSPHLSNYNVDVDSANILITKMLVKSGGCFFFIFAEFAARGHSRPIRGLDPPPFDSSFKTWQIKNNAYRLQFQSFLFHEAICVMLSSTSK